MKNDEEQIKEDLFREQYRFAHTGIDVDHHFNDGEKEFDIGALLFGVLTVGLLALAI